MQSAAMNKTILLIGSYAPSLLNFRGSLIKELISRGYRVVVTAPDIDQEIQTALSNLGAETFEVPLGRTGLNPIADIKYMFSLHKLIKRYDPYFVLTYTIKPNIWGAFAAALCDVRSAAMVTGLGFAFTDTTTFKKKLISRIANGLFRMSTKCNQSVVFQNPDDRDDFIKAGCLGDAAKARMVNGSGVDTNHYQLVPLPEEPVFLMVSRLLGNKGVREYCQAAIVVKKTNPEARFLLVGYFDEGPDGVSQSELDGWVSAGVEYLGPSDDVRNEISKASIYVLPSYREGTPRSVLEAMSMGRSIITSDAPGCRETTIEGKNGFLVAIKDVDALAERMTWMIAHPSERQEMGEASRKLAVEKYDVNQVNRTLLKHLRLS